MCYWYTPDYDGCHNCKYSSEGMTTGKTFRCTNKASIWSHEKRAERTKHILGILPCDHTCELFSKGNK